MVSKPDSFSLVAALREDGFSTSIITTYNAYLPFYEAVVIRRLFAAGCTHNIVLMDARQCAEALSHESTRPQRAGTDYTLIPVPAPGAFHPKIFLRLGKKKGSLFIGSHNLTVAGFGLNDELTNRFEYDSEGKEEPTDAFIKVVQLLRDFVSQSPMEARDSLENAFEIAPWLERTHSADTDKGAVVLGTRTGMPSLWAQVRDRLPASVRRVLILAPFFDRQFEFLRRVMIDLGNVDMVIGLDPETVEANPEAVQALSGVRFVDVRHCVPSVERRKDIVPYLHAKALIFETDEGDFLVTGSANPTAAAFLSPSRERNTECVVLRRLNRNSEVLDELGLRPMFDAKEISNATLKDIFDRVREDVRNRDGGLTHPSAVLAILDGNRLRLNDSVRSTAAIRALDEEGNDIGSVAVEESGPPTLLVAEPSLLNSVVFLRIDDRGSRRWALVHRPTSIAKNYGSDVRRALRQAIVSLDEDPAQLEVLLKLCEKVIFDDDAPIEKKGVLSSHRAGQREEKESEPETTTSLAIEAKGRRGARRRLSIARGDIIVLLDALIRRLGQDGVQEGSGKSPVSEEERVGTDDDTDELPTETFDLERLSAACRRKTRTLLKRMSSQLESARKSSASRRAIIQLAAVLGVIRKLRTVELREEWRRGGQRLLHEDGLQRFFKEACPRVTVSEGAIVPSVLGTLDGESCEELSMALGLLMWLAWECDVDLAVAQGRERERARTTEDQWAPLQSLAYLAPFIACDLRAIEIATESIRDTPRRGRDGDMWMQRHLSFIREISSVASNPEKYESAESPPRPGDVAILPTINMPRVRLVVGVQKGSSGYKVRILDFEKGTRTFLSDYVKRIRIPSLA